MYSYFHDRFQEHSYILVLTVKQRLTNQNHMRLSSFVLFDFQDTNCTSQDHSKKGFKTFLLARLGCVFVYLCCFFMKNQHKPKQIYLNSN
jgi:hypothetical protein